MIPTHPNKEAHPARAMSLVLGVAVCAIIALPPASAGNLYQLDPGAESAGEAARAVVAATQSDSKPNAGKLTLGLDTLAAEYQTYQVVLARGAAVSGGFATRRTLATLVGESVVVDAVAAGDPQALTSALEALGAEVTASVGNLVSARLPLARIDDLESVAALRFARPAMAIAHSGAVASQGDTAQYSDLARSGFTVDGTGSIVGVLSDSFDCSGDGSYAADQTSGDLPIGINVIDDTACPGIDEGRAMAQIVHDVAPGAGLAFHTAFNGEADFAQGILDLAAAGSNVIVDDIIYFAEPMFQDGVVAQAADAVEALGVAYFSSAGNAGREAYAAPYEGSGISGSVFGGELHDFDPGEGTDTLLNLVLPGRGATTIFVLQWSDPFFSVSGAPGAQTDLDILLHDSAGNYLGVGSSVGNVGGDPVEIFGVTNNGNDTERSISIERFSGPNPGALKFVAFSSGGDISFVDSYPGTNAGSLYGHANAAGATAVGAAAYFRTPAFGQTPPLLNDYSSAGNTPILFDSAGNPILAVREKPEFTAPDGGNNTFFGNDYEPDGWPNFFGTSAAAPHAAAVAALMLELDPALTPAQVTAVLQDSAIDIISRSSGAPVGAGFDNDSGAGLIDAQAAVSAVAPPADLLLEAANTADAVTHAWYAVGLQQPFPETPVVIASMQTFDGDNPAGLRLRGIGTSGFQVLVEEERSEDMEVSHITEVVGYLAAQPGIILDSLGNAIGEAGTLAGNQVNNGDWKTVSLQGSYADPVVVMNLNSFNGADPVHVRLRNIAGQSFEYQMEEWDYLDQWHTTETLGFVVVESGSHQLADGRRIEAGSVQGNQRWQHVALGGGFGGVPVVISQSQSYAGFQAVVTRQRNVATTGFDVRLQEEEANDGIHVFESLGFVAVEP